MIFFNFYSLQRNALIFCINTLNIRILCGIFVGIMKIEEAIVYVLMKRNGGMTTEQIAEAINRFGLHIRKDRMPVTGKQVYAVVCRFPGMFTKEAGRIMLMI